MSSAPVCRLCGAWLVPVVLLVACATRPVAADLSSTDKLASAGRFEEALRSYDAIATSSKIGAAERTLAFTAAALVCDKLGRREEAKARLERAVELDVPGASEPALYYLAERIERENRPRALGLYYRAAAGAEKNRAGGFPYRAATDRIVRLMMFDAHHEGVMRSPP